MKTAAAYLRRSTDDKQADSIEIQREEVERYAEQNGYRIVRFYIDEAARREVSLFAERSGNSPTALRRDAEKIRTAKKCRFSE